MPLSLQALGAENVSRSQIKQIKAMPSSTTPRPAETPVTGTAAPKQFFGQLRFESMQYATTVADAPDLNSSNFLSARLSSVGSFEKAPRFNYGVDASAGTFFRRGKTDFIVQEAHLGSRLTQNSNVSVGRRKAYWSEVDDRWQLGLWQPKFALDALRPEDQGLTGVFLDWKDEKYELRGFATPVFIPTMGPEIREEGGGLKSDSRWYREPGRTQNVAGNAQTISYRLDIPEVSKLVANPGAAVMGRLGSREAGPWIAGAWGYKPVNELLLKRAVTTGTNADGVNTVVSPDVEYHDIVSMDAGYALESVQASASVLQDRPRDKGAPTDMVIQRLEPIHAYSAQLDWMIRNVFSRTVQLRLSYLKVNGGGITDIRQDGRRDDFTIFDSRLKFTDAVSVGMEGQLARIAQKPLVTKFRYLYDRDQRGSMVNTEFLLYPRQEWAVLMGADILGVEDDTYKPTGFLNQFRANDRVYGGMSYVF